MPPTILVVDDDPHIRSVLRFALGRDGFATAEAADGAAALAALLAPGAGDAPPDLVLLDVMMPEMDGIEACRRLRRAGSAVPVIFLSSRDEEVDRILGLEIGGDDYVTKPFSPREVVARVRAVLRRGRDPAFGSTGIGAGPEGAAEGAPIRRGVLTLRPDRLEALWDGRAVPLTVTEFAILRALAAAPGRVLTRGTLMEVAYPDRRIVSDRTMDSHVRHIRAKLAEQGGGEAIGTVHGMGYRFVLPPASPPAARDG